MKKALINILFISIALLFTQCFEEKAVIVEVTPSEQIQEKLKELRELQSQINDEDVEIVDLQARIDDLIQQINNLVPVGNVPLSYSIGVISAGAENRIGIPNAEVTIHIRDEVQTGVTNSSGQVEFENLRSGMITVYVSHPDYSDVNFVADLLVDAQATTDASNSGEDYNVTSTIGLYPTSENNGALVQTGNLYFDSDRTNDILPTSGDPEYGRIPFFDQFYTGVFSPAPRLTLTDGAEDNRPTISPILDARRQSWQLLNQSINIFAIVVPDAAYFSYIPPGTEGNIVIAVYSDMYVRAASNTNGTYSLVLPNASRALVYRYRLSEFEGQERYFRAENLDTATGVTSVTTRNRDVIFSPMYLDIVSDGFIFPGAVNAFDESAVNNFNIIWIETRSNLKVDFYYGAKTRDE